MGATIYDVARAAGVSITTVSRVMNGNYPVNAKTRKRVLQAIEETGYAPSHVARSLATNSTSTIGVVGAEMTNPYFVEMMNGIQAVATEHSLQILLHSTNSPEGERNVVRLMLERRVDGIVFIAYHEDAEGWDHIVSASEEVPTVIIGTPLRKSQAYSLRSREEEGAYELARRLVELGHRGFLFLGGKPNSYPTKVKLRGVRRALRDVPGARLKVEMSGYLYESADRLEDLLREGLLDWCTAVMAVSDWVAVGVLDRLHKHGIDVPETVSVTGFDNILWCRSMRPALTSVEPGKDVLARSAVEAIVNSLSGKRPRRKNILVPARVVLRESHGPARDVSDAS